ncbi:hypothetical protein I8751_26895 [Nostocaceae cyanobacterium CENA357]|uniref:Serine protease n=1 Tax=Atlanticothrix silvestris CENA357 TaxID=1725252 RepID=A0A8J7L4E4_9CYAN|nr:CHAT domain-containing protein [Atlanticothrix silvestris]MBH8555905.1 hypothetical protein [Atlanticothrix silvestris CENA357]
MALQVSDRSRARGLIELLTEANIDIKKGIDPKLLAEERRLQWQINAQEKLLSALASKKETPEQLLTNTKQKIQDLLKQQRELEVKIRANNPEYADLIYPQPLTLKQIQQQLDKDTLLLQYSLGEERSYLWAVTPDSLHSYELPGREKIDKAAKNLYNNYLKNPGMLGVSPEETAKAANELSQLILAPVADKLGQKRLVIVGDEALQYIPFAALTTSTKSPDGYENLTAGESMTAGVHLQCSILRRQENLLYHNCDTNQGASGGAIISNINGKYYVLALHSGSNEVNGLLLNRAVEMSRLDEWLQGN